MTTLREICKLFQSTFNEWREDKASRLDAALAYYALFSLSPSLIIVIVVAGFSLWKRGCPRPDTGSNTGNCWPRGCRNPGMLESVDKPLSGIQATVLGFLTLLVGATGVLVSFKMRSTRSGRFRRPPSSWRNW